MHEVVDGQQKLVTLSVLFCAIRDSLGREHALSKEIQEILIAKHCGEQDVPCMEMHQKDDAILHGLLREQSNHFFKDGEALRDLQ